MSSLEHEDERHYSRVRTQNVYGAEASTFDPVYQSKAQILNDELQDIGMGKYQWFLFFVAGFGWLSDNLWPTVTNLILSPVINELGVKVPFLKLAQNIGLFIGAVFWGVISDIWGRRWAFNFTLLITGVFAIAGGASPNYVALCSLTLIWSIGVGGNLPVDSAVFLELVPASHQYLLTTLSIWWAFGQLFGSLVAWPLIANFSCSSSPPPCSKSSNEGWRYFLYTMGGFILLLWVIRFFVFDLYESPKYLMGRGKDKAAVEVIHAVATYNGKTSSLTEEHLEAAEKSIGGPPRTTAQIEVSQPVKKRPATHVMGHVKPLFATRKLAYSTSLLIVVWGRVALFYYRGYTDPNWVVNPALIGLAFPLYNGFVTFYLQSREVNFGNGSMDTIFRSQIILSVIGVPGALTAGYCVELSFLGRRGTLSIFTILTGVFILASTTARTSNALLGWNCAYSFTSNVMYGVLYAVSPELFPTKDRGTGNAIVASANRVFGIMAPIIALYANLNTSVPIWVAGAIFIVAGLVALLLPFDPRGKASL